MLKSNVPLAGVVSSQSSPPPCVCNCPFKYTSKLPLTYPSPSLTVKVVFVPFIVPLSVPYVSDVPPLWSMLNELLPK